ncbi:MAG: hypothetical protein H0U53_03230, partial [Actinobacteria bacterium]|nr:hypothetical protein [Actinomycetota bacterium]
MRPMARFGLLAVVAAACTSGELPASSTPAATTPPTSSQPASAVGASPQEFVPPTRSAEGMTYLTLTLLDGTHMRLAYPEELDLTSLGVEAQTVGSLDGRHSRVIQAHFGPPESFLAETEQLYGTRELISTYPTIDGGTVDLWGFADESTQYLVYDFDLWTVFVWDGRGFSMGEEALAEWAASLRGATYDPGFLVLDSEPALTLDEVAADSGPDGPDIRIDGSSGSLLVFIDDCDRLSRLDEEANGSEVFAFCDEPSNTLFFVGGDPEVQQLLHEELIVDPVPPGFSGDPPQPLDVATGSHVYLSNGFELTVVDVDAATVTVHKFSELAPGDPPYRLVRRGDQLVFYGETETGPALYTVDLVDPGIPELLHDDAWFFVPSAVEDRVWVADLDESSHYQAQTLDAVREITLEGVVTMEAVPPPNSPWLVAAVDRGLVFQGDGTLEIWDPRTQEFVETLSAPSLLATWRNRIVVCDRCDELTLIDLDAEAQRTVDLPFGVALVDGNGGAFSPNGRLVAVTGFLTPSPVDFETEAVTVLVDFEDATATIVPGSLVETRYSYP